MVENNDRIETMFIRAILGTLFCSIKVFALARKGTDPEQINKGLWPTKL